MTDQPDPEDTCRPVDIDGETIRVRGAGEMSDESREALADVIAAAKRKMAAEAPQQIGALQNRLRLAHQARRAKEHQLDDIRRALCDIGFMDDDDPYSHADLADVIRQNGTVVVDEQAACIHPDGYEDECPCPPSCDCCKVTARTTPDSPAASSDTASVPDNPEPGRYLHYKGGQYEVVGTATHTESGDRLVTYRDAAGNWWARPIADFTSGTSEGTPRFTLDNPTNLIDETLDQPSGEPAATKPDTRYAQAIADVQSSGPAVSHDDGPSIAEATKADRLWPLQKAGE